MCIRDRAKPKSAAQIKNLAESLGLFDFAPGAHTPQEYGKYMICQSGHFDYDEMAGLTDHILAVLLRRKMCIRDRKHLLPLRLLLEGRVQAPQQAELCFCHAVVFHAVLTVFLKIHVALQLVDGFIIQPQRFLQSLLTCLLYTSRCV